MKVSLSDLDDRHRDVAIHFDIGTMACFAALAMTARW
jgi:hypothetical protein